MRLENHAHGPGPAQCGVVPGRISIPRSSTRTASRIVRADRFC